MRCDCKRCQFGNDRVLSPLPQLHRQLYPHLCRGSPAVEMCGDYKAQGHEEPTGTAKITPAYNLPCQYVIHTVGPIVQDGLTQKHCNLLKSCYQNCLELAVLNGVKSIAFCFISTVCSVFRRIRRQRYPFRQ